MSLEAMQTNHQKTTTAVPVSGLLQRKCACGGTPGPTGECEACRKKREAATLQRAASHTTVVNAVPPIVHEVLRSPGQPLDPATRAFMEPRFGHDFSRVRVHTDGKAARSAQAVNARAYTVGQDMVFGNGQYMPSSGAGKQLLAHELTHVIQQSKTSPPALSAKMTINQPDDTWEREADDVARKIVSPPIPKGQFPSALATDAPILQRSCSDGRCNTCFGGQRDFWLTAFFRRRATQATMNKLRTEINEAKTILANCCLNLKVDFDWRLLRGSATFAPGTSRPAGDARGAWEYPNDAVTLGEGTTFSAARGIPMLIVDNIPGTGGGVTVSGDVDRAYRGQTYIAVSVNQPGENLANNSIAHELWHVAGRFTHNAADGGITAGTDNSVTPNYCSAVRALVAPIGDFPTPRNRDTAVA